MSMELKSTTTIEDFNPSTSLLKSDNNSWNSLTESDYQKLFRKSAVKRAKYKGLMRNIEIAKKNSK